MKILRSVNRRGFSVGTAGWFTILRPNTWFPASRLRKTPVGFGIQAQGTEEQVPASGVLGDGRVQARAVRWLASEWSAADRNRVRAASAIASALAITAGMLWWILHP